MEDEMQTTDHGTVTYDGLIYRLTQQAYVDNRATGVKYYAHATGPDGEPYLVVWDTTEAWDDHQDGGTVHPDGDTCAYCEDESNACDWEHPVSVVRA